MWKVLITAALTVLATLAMSVSAFACSCICNYGETLSDYFKGNKLFWGVPLSHEQSEYTWESRGKTYIDISVTTRVRVIEAYGQFANNSVIEVISSLEDGISCGYQYDLDKLHLISTYGPDNGVSSCHCRPPLSISVDYLTEKKDLYMPSREECNGTQNRRDRTKRPCRIVRKSWDNESADQQAIIEAFRDGVGTE